MMVQKFHSSARQAMIALASFGVLVVPGIARTPQLDPEDAMVQSLSFRTT
jgi:hypothetical protein